MAKAIRQEWKCFIGALIPRGGRGCCFEFRHKGTGEGRAQFVRVVRGVPRPGLCQAIWDLAPQFLFLAVYV